MSTATITDTKEKQKFREVRMWRVVMLNDDYTPFNFVIEVLTTMYGKSLDEAEQIAMNIHEKGRGVAGIYTKEIAMQKSDDTIRIAKGHGHPLKTQAEEA
jgi:ATP-dependent Clp protease adaptor protein ClpS